MNMLIEGLCSFFEQYKDVQVIGWNKETAVMAGALAFNWISCAGLLAQVRKMHQLKHAIGIPSTFHYFFMMAVLFGCQYGDSQNLLLMQLTSMFRLISYLPFMYLYIKYQGLPDVRDQSIIAACMLAGWANWVIPGFVDVCYSFCGIVIIGLSVQKLYSFHTNGGGATSIISELCFFLNQGFWTAYGIIMQKPLVAISCGIPCLLTGYGARLLFIKRNLPVLSPARLE